MTMDYKTSPFNTVFFMDNMEGMKKYEDKLFDLAVIDPPYGINATNMAMGTNKNRKGDGYPGVSTATKLKGRLNSGGGKLKNRLLNKSEIDWDNEIPTDEFFKELFRVSKNQVIWGGNYFNLPPCRGFIVWDKMQPWENFSQAEFAWTSFDCPSKVFRKSGRGGANSEKKIHPTQKPVELYDFIFSKFAKEGDNILDTHIGSGSIRIAADKAKVNLIGFENNKMHFDDQEKRYANYKSQLELF